MKLEKHLLVFNKGIDISGIQIEINNEPFLFLGAGSHAFVFKKGLEELDVPYEEMRRGNRRIVAPRTNLYTAVGMGISMVGDDWFTISGESTTYWMGVNEEHLEKMKPFLNGYQRM